METLYKKVGNTSLPGQEVFEIDYEKSKNNSGLTNAVLNVRSKLIEKDNYKLSINGQILILVLSEKKEINRPIHTHHIENNLFEKTSYERLRSFNILLSDENNYIKWTYVDVASHTLKIVLGK